MRTYKNPTRTWLVGVFWLATPFEENKWVKLGSFPQVSGFLKYVIENNHLNLDGFSLGCRLHPGFQQQVKGFSLKKCNVIQVVTGILAKGFASPKSIRQSMRLSPSYSRHLHLAQPHNSHFFVPRATWELHDVLFKWCLFMAFSFPFWWLWSCTNMWSMGTYMGSTFQDWKTDDLSLNLRLFDVWKNVNQQYSPTNGGEVDGDLPWNKTIVKTNHLKNKSKYTPENWHGGPQNNGPWKRSLPLKMATFGIYVRFLGCITCYAFRVVSSLNSQVRWIPTENRLRPWGPVGLVTCVVFC